MSWLPVAPFIDQNTGAFRAFRSHPRAAELKPVPLEVGDDCFGSYWQRDQSLRAWQSAQLGVAAVGSFAESTRVTHLVFDAMYYVQKSVAAPLGGVIGGTRWGAGFRLVVAVMEFDAKAEVNLRAVAASTELGLCRSSFEITGYGLSSPKIMSLFPAPGRFDGDTLDAILDAATAMRDRYASGGTEDHRGELTAVPMQVELVSPPMMEPMSAASSMVFVTRRLAERVTLEAATAQAVALGIPTALVVDVYNHYGAADPSNERPSRAAAKLAQAWLDV